MESKKPALEQHIAVLGESGSGKTVLLSSFYGATQEPQFVQKSLFKVFADSTSQGNQLHQNYLGMRDSARLPEPNKFSASSYSFSLKLKDGSKGKPSKGKAHDVLRLVWHDYPGEWFEQDVSGPAEAQRKIDAFKALLGSDVALLLVDGQRLLDNAGEEERYLKSLFSNFRNGLLSLKDELLDAGQPLVRFPRIWVLALSKADLLPDLDVFNFRDLLIGKVAGEIDELRDVLAGFVDGADALSVGEDFLLLSSAKFEPGNIEVKERVGLELIIPMAAILPFERHVRWAQMKHLPHKVAETLLSTAGVVATFINGFNLRGRGRLGKLLSFIGPDIQDAAIQARDKVKEVNAEALAQRDHMRATLSRFRLDLDEAEDSQILLRSPR